MDSDCFTQVRWKQSGLIMNNNPCLTITIFLISLVITLSSSVTLNAQDNPSKQLIEQLNLRESKVPSREQVGWKPVKKVVLWGNNTLQNIFQKEFPEISFYAIEDVQMASKQLEDADAFIGYCIPQLLSRTLNVRWIQSMAVGVENCVNAESIKNSDILLTNAQRLSSPEIAEHAIALMLSLVRQLDQYSLNQYQEKWQKRAPLDATDIWEIEGKTILVVGLGGIGSETARRAHALGMKVIATRNSSRTGPDFVSYIGLSDELHQLAKQADIIVNTVPLTKKTTEMFNLEFFKLMKPSAYFINVARGKSVVTKDLLTALKNGNLAGAGLDVTDPEPLPENHPLWKQSRIIITPHVAYRSEKLRQRILVLSIENLHRYVNGDKLLSQVNIKKGY